MTRRGVLAVAAMVVCAGSVHAVVMREDMSDADAIRLAEPLVAVGRVIPDGACALIAPSWVLTAAHVAATIPANGVIEFGGTKYTVKRVLIHPQGHDRDGMPPEVDLALVEITAPVAGIVPLPLYRGTDELKKTVLIAGYGDAGTPGHIQKTDGRRRAVTNVVHDAGPVRLFLVFDAPPAGTPNEGVGGPGDSGGPCLIDVDGTRYLCGISSASMDGRPGQYGVTDVYVRVSSYIEWIESSMKSK
jgi:hypothetical protein